MDTNVSYLSATPSASEVSFKECLHVYENLQNKNLYVKKPN